MQYEANDDKDMHGGQEQHNWRSDQVTCFQIAVGWLLIF